MLFLLADCAILERVFLYSPGNICETFCLSPNIFGLVFVLVQGNVLANSCPLVLSQGEQN